jgi:exopolyphosphatase/guanosine-5'-triphosphate,3'-diphosphate pyrophosphatase
MRGPIAVIDVGSNTIRSLVFEVGRDGQERILDDEREVARLASGLGARGRLQRAAMRRALTALRRMADIARARGARRFAVVGTSALREATNRRAFVDQVRAETGLRLRVISEGEEARLAFESAALSFDLGDTPCAVVDIGGGSTEIILGIGTHIQQDHSLRLGAVNLTEKHLHNDPVRNKEFRRLRRDVRRALRNARIETDPPPRVLIVSGGTATALAQIAMARQGLQGRPVLGFEMSQGELLHLRSALMRRTLAERRQMPGLSPDRADIILAGTIILYEVMTHLKVNLARVNARGIRHALVHRLVARRASGRAPGPAGPQRLAAAEALGRSLRYEEGHALQARRLSESIFDQIAGPLGLDAAGRDLLSAAALLHDVGYVVGYRQHHKHAYRLIAHAQLEGFTPREREIIALVARYHRRGEPRRRHKALSSLARDDRRMVAVLASVLRIADALDRRHSQGVRAIECRTTRRAVGMTLVADRDLAVEAHAAEEKGDLFEKVFGRDLVIACRRKSAARRHTARPAPRAAARSEPAPSRLRPARPARRAAAGR